MNETPSFIGKKQKELRHYPSLRIVPFLMLENRPGVFGLFNGFYGLFWSIRATGTRMPLNWTDSLSASSFAAFAVDGVVPFPLHPIFSPYGEQKWYS